MIAVLMSAVASPVLVRSASCRSAAVQADFEAIERDSGGRLGVAAFDSATSRRLLYRPDEPFPMCSTFKWLLAAQLLALVDAGQEHLLRPISYAQDDLLEYAPVTRAHVAEGRMTVADLAGAAIQASDNTAANLLLRAFGGPVSFTTFLRRIGDQVSRLDRIEPELNSADPGDVRDTTTPRAMLMNMERLLLGDRLQAASRDRLIGWLVGSTTGANRLQAGLPPGWRIGDKTGTGAHGATSDVAIAWPSARKPVLVAAYLAETPAPIDVREAALAAVGRCVTTWIGTE